MCAQVKVEGLEPVLVDGHSTTALGHPSKYPNGFKETTSKKLDFYRNRKRHEPENNS